jgi:hypothetical protein
MGKVGANRITRWSLLPDGRIEPGAKLSLANLGTNQVAGARRSVFVAFRRVVTSARALIAAAD